MKTTGSNFVIKELQDPEIVLVHGGDCNCYCIYTLIIQAARIPASRSMGYLANHDECRRRCISRDMLYSRCER